MCFWADKNEILSREQKGFRKFSGCSEHNFELRSAIIDGQLEKKSLFICFFDIQEAFTSIPHFALFQILKALTLAKPFIDIIEAMYADAKVGLKKDFKEDGKIKTFRAIPVKAGVLQGDKLSPLLFIICVEYLFGGINGRMEADDPDIVEVLAYADDLALRSASPSSLQIGIIYATTRALEIGLLFKPAKCACLGTLQGELNTQFVFNFNATVIKTLDIGDTYKYLGVEYAIPMPRQLINLIDQC